MRKKQIFTNKYILIFPALLVYLLGFYFSYTELFTVLIKSNQTTLIRNVIEYGTMYLSLLFFCAWIYKVRFLRIIPYLLLILLSLNFLISVICFTIYKSSFNSGMVLSILDTNAKESLSMSSMFIYPIIFALLFWVLNIYLAKSISKITFPRFLILLSFLWIIFPVLFKLKHKFIENKGGGSMIKSVYYHYNDFLIGYNLKKDLENIKSNHVNYPLKKNRKEISTIVLLIGESVQPKHMQLYGYERKNTPYQVKEIKNMRLYRNALSPAGITNLSVPLMLSSIQPEEFLNNKIKIADNVVNFAEQKGYETYWMSTQSLSGIISIIASYSNNRKYFNGYDEVILPEFYKVLKNKNKKLIILHLMGSHPNPCDKIPEKEKIYSKNNIIDCYDSSINYTDKIIGEILNKLRDENSVFIYASDHGLKIKGDKMLHTDSKESTKVPFYIWFSPKLPKEVKETGIIESPVQTIMIYPQIIEFMGYKTNNNYQNLDFKYLNLDLKAIDYSNLKD